MSHSQPPEIKPRTASKLEQFVESCIFRARWLLAPFFSGYENFVSKLNIGNHEDRPAWMGKVGFSGLKMKLISAIVAISAVELLKVFISSTSHSSDELLWKVIIHVTFVISGVMFALTDFINSKTHNH
ncbi:YqhA family protein [Pseudoalteromonas prydzensis]|uniref:YqhA family protein n=1 Tax=Pseudoalteromonas prydzensis TaxID=182141 RepID=UPI0037046FD0